MMVNGIVSSSNTNVVQVDVLAQAVMGSSSIVFSNIPQNYDSLVVYGALALSVNISGNTESYPGIRFNDDAGSNYSRTLVSAAVTNNSQSNVTAMDIAVPGPSSVPWIRRCQIEMYIDDYTTTKFKKFYGVWSRRASTGTTILESGLYQWRSTSAINKISLITGYSGGSPSGNFLAESSFILYGLRKG